MKVKLNPHYIPPSMIWDYLTETWVEDVNRAHPYYTFDPDKEYVVLDITWFFPETQAENHFRLMKDIKIPLVKPLICYLSPTLYKSEMFMITDEAIPEDWEILVALSKITVAARDLGVYTYSDLCRYGNQHKTSCYAQSNKIGRYGWVDYFDRIEEARARIGPYLEQVYQEQLAWNQARASHRSEESQPSEE